MNRTVLLIEDDPSMARGLKDNFEFAGYTVRTARDGDQALEALKDPPQLIILDIMLPKINGFEICRYIRNEGMDIPVIMLSAKDQESDVVLGLTLGADDYVIKPFSMRELLARSEALLRRHQAGAKTVLSFGDCRLDLHSHRFEKGGVEVPLSPREFDLLAFFAQHAGKALSREKIMNAVWGHGRGVTLRSVDRFVTTLRTKIEENSSAPKFIHTIREFGYRFEPMD